MEAAMSDLAKAAAGVEKPRSFILDSSVYDAAERHEITREDVRVNRVEFVFPDGINDMDVRDICRALGQLDDFDVMYDLVMKMLAGRGLIINIKNLDGTKTELCAFQVTHEGQNLRGIDALNTFPWLMDWLLDFMRNDLLKKYPMPGIQSAPRPTASTGKSPRRTPITRGDREEPTTES
jgi:hypothetical protein